MEWNFSASSFCSLSAFLSDLNPFCLLYENTVADSASSFALRAVSYDGDNSDELEMFSNISTSCFGVFRAIDSTSPWKTRKLRALRRTPISESFSSYFLNMTGSPFTLYCPTPSLEMLRPNLVSSPVSASLYTMVADALSFLSIFFAAAPGGRKIRSLICDDRRSRDCTPRTKDMASIRLDFPEPFGPMTQVKSWNGPMVCRPA
mmetsp:Transcript_62932/g.185865  ORF Transcript_62932/g.185865 Transcript_62932/m.185865 type:complete len:204 (-) Transcript_62932:638-1249(-)